MDIWRCGAARSSVVAMGTSAVLLAEHEAVPGSTWNSTSAAGHGVRGRLDPPVRSRTFAASSRSQQPVDGNASQVRRWPLAPRAWRVARQGANPRRFPLYPFAYRLAPVAIDDDNIPLAGDGGGEPWPRGPEDPMSGRLVKTHGRRGLYDTATRRSADGRAGSSCPRPPTSARRSGHSPRPHQRCR
jgi:hypothetical protein